MAVGMASGASDMNVVSFSSDILPKCQRALAVRQIFEEAANAEFTPLTEDPSASMQILSLPGIELGWGSSSPHRIDTMRDRSVGNDDFAFMWGKTVNPAYVEHVGHEANLAGGMAVLTSCADRLTIENHAGCSHVVVRLSRSALLPLLPRAQASLMRPMPLSHPALRLLAGYTGALRGQLGELISPHVVAGHLADLVALSLGAEGDAARQAMGGGVRAARLKAIEQWILARLHHAELGIADVAAAHRLSVRYVQKLFHNEGTTFSAFLLNARLRLVHRHLQRPWLAGRRIGALAYEAGFGDLAYFNRAFRRLYGETPSDVRSAAKPE